MDKTTLGSAAILGIRQGAHLTTNEWVSFFAFILNSTHNVLLQQV
jgi:hypothetical protein